MRAICDGCKIYRTIGILLGSWILCGLCRQKKNIKDAKWRLKNRESK